MRRRVGAVVALCALVLSTLQAPASAFAFGPGCTLSWDGGGDGSSWMDAANWDLDRLPTSDFTEHVCIGASAASIAFTDGWFRLASIRSDAPLNISAGRLDLGTSYAYESTLHSLQMSGGRLDGKSITVETTFDWSGGDVGNSEEPTILDVGPYDAPAGTGSLHATAGEQLLRGWIRVNGPMDVDAGAYISLLHGRIDAKPGMTIAGVVSASHLGLVTGDIVVEAGGALYGPRIEGSLHNKGTVDAARIDPADDDPTPPPLLNEGTATLGGVTGGLQNAAGATLIARDFLSIGGPLDNQGRIEVGTPQVETELQISGSGAGGTWEIVQGDVTIFGSQASPTTISGAVVEGYGIVRAANHARLAGQWQVGPSVMLELDGPGAALAGADISATQVSWADARILPGAGSTIDAAVFFPALAEPVMTIPAGAQLTNAGSMSFDEYVRVAGTGTLVNDGSMVPAFFLSPYREPDVAFEPAVRNNGTIDLPAGFGVGPLTNTGLLKLGPSGEIDVAGRFEQTSSGTLELGAGYTTNFEGPPGMSAMSATEASVAGTIDVTGEGCVAQLAVVSAPVVTGTPALSADATRCKYGLRHDADALTLFADDTTPPALPTYDYGAVPGQWYSGVRVPGGVVPDFRIQPITDYWTPGFQRDDITGLYDLYEWWDLNPVSDETQRDGSLRRMQNGDTIYLMAYPGQTHFWHHVVAYDWAGNSTEVRHEGPFLVDPDKPIPPTLDLDTPSDVRHVRGSTFEIRWSPAYDAASGLNDPAYAVASGASSAALSNSDPSTTNGTSYRFVAEPNSPVCARVTAHDKAGHSAQDSSCFTTPLDDRQFVAGKAWVLRDDPHSFFGGDSTTTRQGASLRRDDVMSRKLWLVATQCGKCGTVDVYWDGVFHQRVRLRSEVYRKKGMVAIRAHDDVRLRTLTLRVASTGKPVSIQGVAFRP